MYRSLKLKFSFIPDTDSVAGAEQQHKSHWLLNFISCTASINKCLIYNFFFVVKVFDSIFTLLLTIYHSRSCMLCVKVPKNLHIKWSYKNLKMGRLVIKFGNRCCWILSDSQTHIYKYFLYVKKKIFKLHYQNFGRKYISITYRNL